jgi:DNA polymerase-3 subunit gamma/tau
LERPEAIRRKIDLFENIIRQPVTNRLVDDISSNALAPAMLFAGPPASGKGTAALEIGRAFSCETEGAPWNCRCQQCALHRSLSHNDLVITGSRLFSAEIAAARAALIRDTSSASSRILFLRSVRKLLLRFSPVLLADDPKIAKLNGILEPVNDAMEELNLLYGKADGDAGKIAKLCDAVVKHTQKLEAEGIPDMTPVSHIRNAAYWLRIAPSGRRKLLVIENADRMQDAARNSLLKILEEPPETSAIILCSPKPEALIPTILSRLRHYMFVRRGEDADAEVVRRVFKESADAIPAHSKVESGVTAYLDTFLPVPKAVLYPAAAFFWASIAEGLAASMRSKGIQDGEVLRTVSAIGARCAPIAETAGFGKASAGVKNICAAVMAAASNFTSRGAFTVFLGVLCASLSDALTSVNSSPVSAAYRRIFLKNAASARAAADVYNQSPHLVLERLSFSLLNDMMIV